MKNIKLALWAILLSLSGLWLLAVAWPESANFFAIRGVMVQYSGVLGMGIMSIAMFLAMRPRWLEPVLGGLDKSYRLHKWLGIAGLTVATTHWLWAKGPKWLVGWGLLERPQRGPRPGNDADAVLSWSETIQQLFREQRGFAESVGEWAFYGAAILMILALIKAFPYHWFAKTHKWIAVAYLVLVFHSTILVDFSYWSQPVGWVTALLMVMGTVSAILVLLGRVGAAHRVHGAIEALEYHKELRILETTIKLNEGWPGHQAGQFAFVNFDDKEGRHPFTIASDWNPETRNILFISKALGDYTELMPDRLHVNSSVSVEGPYGRFTFDDEKPRQIWVGAGIGITPFVARMKEMAQAQPKNKAITLFCCTPEPDPLIREKLEADARAANIELRMVIDGKDERLTGERVRALIPEWLSASVWFCGPAAFGQSLRADLTLNGLATQTFHQELFQMR